MATLTINDTDKQVLRSAIRGENPYARLTHMSETARDRARPTLTEAVRKLRAARVLDADHALTSKGQEVARAAGLLARETTPAGERAPRSTRELAVGAAW